MPTAIKPQASGTIPLCVDLDGTLIKSDLLYESMFALLKSNPIYAFMIPFWLMRGKAYLKHRIAQQVDLDVTILPYRTEFVDYLRTQHAQGRHLVLVTASHQKFAHQIANHLGLFASTYASDQKTNLAGAVKLSCLVQEFGERGFDYAGNARTDLPVWSRARKAIVVAPQTHVRAAAEKVAELEQIFDGDRERPYDYIRAMRPHQWIKNLLVFVPLIASHKVDDWPSATSATLGFMSFSLCAASVYLLNDLLDLSSDRHHPTKRMRPLAAGRISIASGTALIPLLLASAFAISLLLPSEFALLLGSYYLLTLAYSMRLKQVMMLDVVLLAGLYTIRIIAGVAAIAEQHSFWLLALSMFLFLSLAMAKRCAELIASAPHEGGSLRGRHYRKLDSTMVASLGAASGQISVLVLALYISQEDIIHIYANPEILWLLCPLLLYWIGRVWLIANRGQLHEDPVVFALRDRISWLLGIVGLAIVWLAI